jgi:hypothetical protein
MKTKYLIVTLIGLFLVASCVPAAPVEPTPDVNSIRTSAAYTVVAEFTLTAAVFTPSPLPPTETLVPDLPTETPTQGLTTDPTLAAQGTAAALCDDYTFDATTVDVTIPDGTPMTLNQEFVKTWKIKNTGTCSWGDGYGLIYSHGERMSGQPVPLAVVVQTGQEIEVSVNFKAPGRIGEFVSAWTMSNANGLPFGKAIFVKIIVQ